MRALLLGAIAIAAIVLPIAARAGCEYGRTFPDDSRWLEVAACRTVWEDSAGTAPMPSPTRLVGGVVSRLLRPFAGLACHEREFCNAGTCWAYTVCD